jgi:hypothetical protein
MRVADPKRLSSAIVENMRYLENLLNQTFNFDHDILSNVSASQHHTKYTDAEVDTRIGLADLADLATTPHSALTGVTTSQHHVKYTDTEAVDAANAEYVWGTWSPTYATLTIGNGTVVARYTQIGDTVHFYWHLIFGTTTVVGTTPTISLPVQAASHYVDERNNVGGAHFLDSGTATYVGFVRFETDTTMTPMVQKITSTYLEDAWVTASIPHTWATGDMIVMQGTYEVV